MKSVSIEELEKAKKLLHENGYIVVNFTKEMEDDSDRCEACCGEGDCLSCACNICIVH